MTAIRFRSLLTLILLVLPVAVNAADSVVLSPSGSATRGAFFALSVADLEASSRWYADAFGLAVVMDRPRADGVAVRVLEGGGLTVELIQRDGARPDPCGTGDPTLCHGLFKVGLSVKDLSGALQSLAARGILPAFGPFPAQGGQAANAILRDPGGNLVQLFER